MAVGLPEDWFGRWERQEALAAVLPAAARQLPEYRSSVSVASRFVHTRESRRQASHSCAVGIHDCMLVSLRQINATPAASGVSSITLTLTPSW
ncbi:MAG TPA: hypothetical protein VIO16_02885, partial [Dehalococcoidia bacterium]